MCLQIVCPRWCKVTLIALVWFFPTLCFQMCPQVTCLRKCRIALVAFVWLFSTMGSQMFLKITCVRGCIITLIAFVWFFSTVGFQMFLQMACPYWCKAALVAFVWLFSTVGFQMSPQITCIRCSKVTSVVSNRSHGRMQNRIGCICLAWCHSLPLLNEPFKWLKIMLHERQWKLCCTSLKSWVELKTKWRLQINFQRSD